MNESIVGKSVAIKRLTEFIHDASLSVSPVLLLGETGVGKGLAAKVIHQQSSRKDQPFLKINCLSLPESLLESELFGHRKGAFTGACADKPGLIEAANRGVLFFDEIGDLSLSSQTKILSIIEDKEVRRIGETFCRKINAHFIFATNKNLHELVRKNKFRKDLFYRINIWCHVIPPLRERKEDIPALIKKILEKNFGPKSSSIEISKEAMDKFMGHNYPGNVRELENLLIRACEMSGQRFLSEENIIIEQSKTITGKTKKTKHNIKDIIDAIIKCNGNKTKAANELNISRVHLYRLLYNQGDSQENDNILHKRSNEIC